MSSAQLKKFSLVKPAEIEWRNGLPFSLEFNDVYFSVHGAVEESSHVFIKGNQLEEDWDTNDQNQFCIGELGFGSGLNFFNTADHWLRHFIEKGNKNQSKHLHYIGIEKRPFSVTDFILASKLWPSLKKFSEQLLLNYPSPSYGRHQLYFKQWNLTLTLFYMPLENALTDLIKESRDQSKCLKIDHWYLDGFSPSKNPSMWNNRITNAIALLSKPGTRLATYSVCKEVKKSISDAGFEIKKAKGFAQKREMLTAKLINPKTPCKQSKFINIKYEKPWFNIENRKHSQENKNLSAKRNLKVGIIGSGIAGCTTAYSLASKGFDCDLFESNSEMFGGASGVAAGIFHPQLTADMNHASEFNWIAYMRLLRFLENLTSKQKSTIILSQGIHRFLKNSTVSHQLLALCKHLNISEWLYKNTRYSNQRTCISFPQSAVINIQAYCKLLLNLIPSHLLSIKTNSNVINVKPINNRWHLSTERAEYEYDHVIYCGGAKSKLLDRFGLSSINITRGQNCRIKLDALSKTLSETLCEKVYVVPENNSYFHIGATFEDFYDDQLNRESQNDLLIKASLFLQSIGLPKISNVELESCALQGAVGYRLHSMDRMPIVGGVVNSEKFSAEFTNMGQRRLLREKMSFYNLPGLWVNSAYGSHGLLFSLLATEHLTSLMTNAISPIPTYLSNTLSPARFNINEIKSA